ncbi:hypothetical protein SPURM210S_06544 [Streptomyces purpurascens]
MPVEALEEEGLVVQPQPRVVDGQFAYAVAGGERVHPGARGPPGGQSGAGGEGVRRGRAPSRGAGHADRDAYDAGGAGRDPGRDHGRPGTAPPAGIQGEPSVEVGVTVVLDDRAGLDAPVRSGHEQLGDADPRNRLDPGRAGQARVGPVVDGLVRDLVVVGDRLGSRRRVVGVARPAEDPHGERLARAGPERPAHRKGEGRVGALVLAEVYAVEPDLGAVAGGQEGDAHVPGTPGRGNVDDGAVQGMAVGERRALAERGGLGAESGRVQQVPGRRHVDETPRPVVEVRGLPALAEPLVAGGEAEAPSPVQGQVLPGRLMGAPAVERGEHDAVLEDDVGTADIAHVGTGGLGGGVGVEDRAAGGVRLARPGRQGDEACRAECGDDGSPGRVGGWGHGGAPRGARAFVRP